MPLSIAAAPRDLDLSALLQKYDVPGPRYTSYPTAAEWRPLGQDVYAGALDALGKKPAEPLSLYLHLPFCRELCSYCGCNVVVTREQKRADIYLDHLEQELALVAGRIGEGRSFTQLHFGGGTPTFLSEAQLRRLWAGLSRHYQAAPGAEIAVEIDPVVTSQEQLALLRSFGFNRLSMGVQDLDPTVQQAIHRIQSVESTAEALRSARALGFQGINFDMICGLPYQTPASWTRTLAQVIAMRPDRVAAYSFAYVPEVRPNQRRLPAEAIPRGADKLALIRLTRETFLAAGYVEIGMDHFALPGDELSRAQAEGALWRNFQGYTVRRAGSSIGFGASGISDLEGIYAQNLRTLPAYYRALEAGRLATDRGIVLSADDGRRRELITALMCNFSVELGPSGCSEFAPELSQLAPMFRDGLVILEGTRLVIPERGRTFLRNVAMAFDTWRRGADPAFSQTV